MPMPRLALPDDRAVGHIQCGEQGRGAVAEVIVGNAFGVTQPHRQNGLTALQCLDLALLVHAQHQRIVRRVEIQPDDIAYFLHKERVVGERERPVAVRLQPEQRKVALYAALGQSLSLGKAAHAPVGRLRGARGQGTAHQCGNLLIIVGARAARWFVPVHARQAPLKIAGTPQPHRGRAHPQSFSDRRVAVSIRINTIFARHTSAWGSERERA